MADSTNQYIWTLPDQDFVAEASKLETRYRTACETLGLRNNWRLTYAQQYGKDPNFVTADAGVQAIGDVDGINELRLRTNLVKVYSRQAVILALGERVGYQAVATNLDVQSQAQVGLVAKMLDYVVTEAKVDETVFAAASSNQTYGAGGIHVLWDLNKGDLVDAMEPATDPETGETLTVQDEAGNVVPYMKPTKKQSGSITLKRVFPWQVCKDVLLEDPNWIIVQEPYSRFELAAMFPEKSDDILKAPGPNPTEAFEMLGFCTSLATDDVVILRHAHHRNCKAVPGGRYVGYLDGVALWSRRCPVQDGLPYTEICSLPYDGTSLGHPESADMSAQQEVLDDMVSAAVTNITRYKDQPLFVDERLKYDGDKNVYTLPEGVDAPKTATYQQLPEAAKFMLEWLPAQMRNTAGLNDAVMGQPEGANMSGVAIASLVQTAVKLQRATQLAIDTAYNDVGNIALELIRNNASDGLVAEIAGHTDAPLVRFFSQQDVNGIRRVKIIRTSPILGTIAGKLELWKSIEGKPVDTQRKIVEMFTTNSFEPLFEDDYSQTDVLRWENEELTAGRPVTVSTLDDPKIHIQCHRSQMDKIRMQPDSPEKIAAIKAFGAHIAEHSQVWLSMDPVTAEALGIPLPSARQQAPAPAPAGANPSSGGGSLSAIASQPKLPAPVQPAQPHPSMPR